MGGANTGPPSAPVLDAEHRPITAGGFVKTSPILFEDVSVSSCLSQWHHRMGTPQKPFILETIGSGVALLDYDNDGWLDLFEANGHVYPQVDQTNWGTTWKQRPLLFHNVQGKLKLVPAVEGTGLATLGVGRGMAFGDLFNDGKIDVVINNLDKTPTLLRNVVKNGNHRIELLLVGGPKSPRDAVGATVYVTANGFR